MDQLLMQRLALGCDPFRERRIGRLEVAEKALRRSLPPEELRVCVAFPCQA
jgi:hypothetical protein